MKSVRADNLGLVLQGIVDEYASEATEILKEETKKTAKAAVKNLKMRSPEGKGSRKGHYKDGWTSKAEKEGSSSVSYVVYNRTKPGLIHLLENGHANRGGGRTEGKSHVRPVADEAERELLNRLEARL